jgi:hypothetical protein
VQPPTIITPGSGPLAVPPEPPASLPPPSSQPTTTPEQFSPAATSDNSKFKRRFYPLAGFNLVFVIIPMLFLVFLSYESNHGVSGLEFVALLLIPVFLIGIAVLVANVLLLPYWLRKFKPTRGYRISSILMILFSLSFVGYQAVSSGIYSHQRAKGDARLGVQTASQLIASCQVNNLDEDARTYKGAKGADQSVLFLKHSVKGEGTSNLRYVARSDFRALAKVAYASYPTCGDVTVLYAALGDNNGAPNLTLEQARAYLNSCKILAVFYRDDNVMVGQESAANYGSSGLAYNYASEPVELYMDPMMVPVMTPLITSASQSCGSIPIFHNYRYSVL